MKRSIRRKNQSRLLASVVAILAAASIGCSAARAYAEVPDQPDLIEIGAPVRDTNSGTGESTTPSTSSGKIVSVKNIGAGQEPVQRFLQLREAGGGVSGEDVAPVLNYPVKGIARPYDRVFDPQFSPDGELILFKVGFVGERRAKYRLYIWDLKTRLVYPVSKP